MQIALVPSTPENAQIIRNLYPLYMHDLSAFLGEMPNVHGIFEADDSRTWEEWLTRHQGIWWEKPGVLFPQIIMADGRPAGFVLVASPPYVPKGIDYMISEFFLLHPFRGKGVGEAALARVLEQFRGAWECHVLSANRPALRFWRRALLPYGVTESESAEAVIFRFAHR
ncbi:MAG TPA: GNAT family N-acetyltransferase [Symbiobacteriaceae bacterium]|nr:GNAT family N-acetyltransferase [Symbiobacteriaceae bacterium]